jgi:hypothetical protein
MGYKSVGNVVTLVTGIATVSRRDTGVNYVIYRFQKSTGHSRVIRTSLITWHASKTRYYYYFYHYHLP